MFTISSQTRRELGAKDLGQAYSQPEQVITIMNNHATRKITIPFLTSIPSKMPWELLQAYVSICRVYPSDKSVLADQVIALLGSTIETIKG